MFSPTDFFEPSPDFQPLLDSAEYVWDLLKSRDKFIADLLHPNVVELDLIGRPLEQTAVIHEGKIVEGRVDILQDETVKHGIRVVVDGQIIQGATVVYKGATLFDSSIQLGENVVVEPGAVIKGPTWIGPETIIRHSAYIRGHCIISRKCVVGHVTEIKGSILMEEAKAAHFAYVGDSVLGKDTNLGAGTKLANVKFRIGSPEVVISFRGKKYPTGLRKFGAVLGDKAETGCNAVCNPGTLVGKRTMIMSGATVRGYYPPSMLISSTASENIRRY